MPRLTKEQRAEYEAALAADDEDDTDDQVTISKGDMSFTGSFRRALGAAEAWGIKLVAEPKPKAEPKDEGKDKGVTAFGRRVG